MLTVNANTLVARIIFSIGVAISLLALPNPVSAADAKLTNKNAQETLWQYFKGHADKVEVIGVLELPQQNTAQVDISISGLLLARPKNDAVTAYAFGPGGGTSEWSGRGKAIFMNYNDGRWVLTEIVAAGSRWDNLNIVVGQHYANAQDNATSRVRDPGDCEVLLPPDYFVVTPYKGDCSGGLAEGHGTYTRGSKHFGGRVTTVTGEFRKGQLNGKATLALPGGMGEGEFRNNAPWNYIYRGVMPNGVRFATQTRDGKLIARCAGDGKDDMNCSAGVRETLLGNR